MSSSKTGKSIESISLKKLRSILKIVKFLLRHYWNQFKRKNLKLYKNFTHNKNSNGKNIMIYVKWSCKD
ncbi:hypothetical protein BLOT_004110 [Blomia tropicalis]|nr:hypothetical protein BLOT_004110 [Blomia tropicalis]